MPVSFERRKIFLELKRRLGDVNNRFDSVSPRRVPALTRVINELDTVINENQSLRNSQIGGLLWLQEDALEHAEENLKKTYGKKILAMILFAFLIIAITPILVYLEGYMSSTNLTLALVLGIGGFVAAMFSCYGMLQNRREGNSNRDPIGGGAFAAGISFASIPTVFFTSSGNALDNVYIVSPYLCVAGILVGLAVYKYYDSTDADKNKLLHEQYMQNLTDELVDFALNASNTPRPQRQSGYAENFALDQKRSPSTASPTFFNWEQPQQHLPLLAQSENKATETAETKNESNSVQFS